MKGRKRSKAMVTHLSDVLPAVGKAMHIDKKAQEWSVLSLWATVVDTPFEKNTRAVKLDRVGHQNRLIVHTETSVVASELTFYLEQYQEKLNSYCSQTGITVHRIELRTGTVASV